MGACDLLFDCKASTFDDVVDEYNKTVEEQEERGYDKEDPYLCNITSFGGISFIEGIAENRETAQEIVLSNTQKWGIAKAKLYYPKEYNNSNKLENKKKLSKINKLRNKINKEKEKKILKVTTYCNLIKSNEKKKFITCYSCKSKIAKQYVDKCLNISNGHITNKCIICHNVFLNINNTKLVLLKEEYKKIPSIYEAVYGGWAAS